MSGYYRLAGGLVAFLENDEPFPSLDSALNEPNGLLAIGGDLTPERLLEAYRLGVFPWFSPGEPILWWSPDPRMVLFPQQIKVSRSLEKKLRRGDYEIRFDTAFRAVMEACAEAPRQGQNGTWIVQEMIEAYCRLHELGYAHSAEAWLDGELVGGLYGVAIGRMFYGESMFHRVTDASKVAFVHLVRLLHQNGYGLIDCQMHTSHLASFGASEIPRAEFMRHLTQLTVQNSSVNWTRHDPSQ